MKHRMLAGALALATSCVSLSCSSPQPAPPAAAQNRAFIDPQTGERRAPTAEEKAAMPAAEAAPAKSAAPGVQVITLPDGSRKAIMNGRGGHYSKAVVDEDGHVHKDCDGAHAAEEGQP